MLGVRRTLGRIRVGLRLALDGVLVLRNHPKLAVLPLLSGVATLCYLLALVAPVLVVEATVGLESLGEVGVYAGLFVWYFGTAFLAAYFNAALVHATGDVFAGEAPGLRRSLRAAAGEVKLLLVWAFASAVVGVLLRLLENSNNLLADVVRAVFALGWTVTTFFVIPVIVFEDTSVRGLFEESARTFRETWGETLGVGAGVSLLVGAATLVTFVAAVSVGSLLAGLPLAVLLGLAALLLGYLAYATVWGVVKTALYVYAEREETPAEFDDVDLDALGEPAD